MGVAERAVAERVEGQQQSRTRSLLVAVAVGGAVGAAVYRLMRRPGS